MVAQRNISLIANELAAEQHGEFWLAGLKSEFKEKLAFRGRSTEHVLDDVSAKEDRLRRLWERRLAQQMRKLPAYDNVFRDVRRILRSAGLGRSLDTPGQPL